MNNFKKTIPKVLNLFDVSLRDSLQTWKRVPSLDEKKYILKNIVKKTPSKKVELGSIVSPKILPQFVDSIELYHYCRKKYRFMEPYLLIPNLKMHEIALHNKIENMSFITSVSEEFQIKNTKMTLQESKEQIKKMINKTPGKTKIYISCINECPIKGIIPTQDIITEITDYAKLPIDELCLSDTCGTIDVNIFRNIISQISHKLEINNKCRSLLSVHLHKNKNENITKNIINFCLEEQIFNFDVSCIQGGGCSVTMDSNKTNDNLNYYHFEDN